MNLLDAALAKQLPVIGTRSDGTPVWSSDPSQSQRLAWETLAVEWETIGDRQAKVAEIKARCATDILERYPDWKQRNMIARGMKLLAIRQVDGREWTAEEAAEAAELDAAWAWIEERRAQSNQEEANLP